MACARGLEEAVSLPSPSLPSAAYWIMYLGNPLPSFALIISSKASSSSRLMGGSCTGISNLHRCRALTTVHRCGAGHRCPEDLATRCPEDLAKGQRHLSSGLGSNALQDHALGLGFRAGIKCKEVH